MSNRGSTSASRRTPFTVHAMHPKGRHLHPFDWIRWRGSWRAGPARRTLGRWWLLSCTCILGREGRDVQPFGASHGPGNGEEYSGRADMAGIPRAHHSVFVDQFDSLPGVDRRERITNSAEVDEGDGTIAQRTNDRG
jgi:hypothetical protein